MSGQDNLLAGLEGILQGTQATIVPFLQRKSEMNLQQNLAQQQAARQLASQKELIGYQSGLDLEKQRQLQNELLQRQEQFATVPVPSGLRKYYGQDKVRKEFISPYLGLLGKQANINKGKISGADAKSIFPELANQNLDDDTMYDAASIRAKAADLKAQNVAARNVAGRAGVATANRGLMPRLLNSLGFQTNLGNNQSPVGSQNNSPGDQSDVQQKAAAFLQSNGQKTTPANIQHAIDQGWVK